MEPSASASEFKLPLKDKPTPATTSATNTVKASSPEQSEESKSTVAIEAVETNQADLDKARNFLKRKLIEIGYDFSEICEEHNLSHTDFDSLNTAELRSVYALANKTKPKPF